MSRFAEGPERTGCQLSVNHSRPAGVVESVRRTVQLAIPLSLIMFGLVTVRATLAGVDGPPMDVYGFPWAWHWASISTSMTQEVRIVALIADLAVYFAVAMLLAAVAGSRLSDRWSLRIVNPVRVLGVVVAVCLVFALGETVRGELPPYASPHYSLALGLP
jgi:hypothetical protein